MTTTPRPHHEADRAQDLDLARRAASGERRAMEQLVARVLPRVRTAVRYTLGPRVEPDDVVQAVLVEVLHSIDGFSGAASLPTWVDRIAVRVAIRAAQKQRRWWQRHVAVEVLPEPPTAGPPDAPEIRRRLAALLQALDPKHRVVLVLRLVFEHDLDEIAAMTEVPVNTVRDRLQVGRRKLRRLAERDPLLSRWTGFDTEPDAP